MCRYWALWRPLCTWKAWWMAILKGMGEQLATFRYSVLDSILRIAGILWLMPQYGMPGFLAVMTASNLLTCGLNTGRMVKKLGSRS